MGDYAVTATSVVPTATTTQTFGTAGATITAGQPVYIDTGDSNKIKPAANTSALTATVAGVALANAASGQPVFYATGGDVTFNSIFTAAVVVVLGSAAGGLSASADLDASSGTRYGAVVGIATSATNLKIRPVNSGVIHA